MFTMLMAILERHKHILGDIFPTIHVNTTLSPAVRVLYLYQTTRVNGR